MPPSYSAANVQWIDTMGRSVLCVAAWLGTAVLGGSPVAAHARGQSHRARLPMAPAGSDAGSLPAGGKREQAGVPRAYVGPPEVTASSDAQDVVPQATTARDSPRAAVKGPPRTKAQVTASIDDELEGLLAEVVTTSASKTPEILAEAPAFVSTITGTDLNRLGIRNLAEALNFLSVGLVAQWHGSRAIVGGRGVTLPGFGAQILLSIDGHNLNDPGSGFTSFDQWIPIPIELIDHIEVILGPGSVLYGTNAMIAVVNVVTKRGSHIPGFRVLGDADLAPAQDRHGGLTGPSLKDSGFRMVEVPVHHFPRMYGTSQFFKPKRILRAIRAFGVWYVRLVILREQKKHARQARVSRAATATNQSS